MSIQQSSIKLISNDGASFTVAQNVAFKSRTIKDMCQNMGFIDGFEMNVSQADAVTLKKVLEYCEIHRAEEYKPKGKGEIQSVKLTKVQEEYLNVSDDVLVKIITAADFLNIPGLLDITSQKLANMIHGKTSDEMRRIFMQPDDLTVEEKEEVQKKWEWLEL